MLILTLIAGTSCF